MYMLMRVDAPILRVSGRAFVEQLLPPRLRIGAPRDYPGTPANSETPSKRSALARVSAPSPASCRLVGLTGEAMPQKAKRASWRSKKRRRPTSVDSKHGAPPTPAAAGRSPKVRSVHSDEVRQMGSAEDRIDTYARLEWLNDYTPVFRLEAELNGAAEEVQTLASAYRLRQLGRDDEEAT